MGKFIYLELGGLKKFVANYLNFLALYLHFLV